MVRKRKSKIYERELYLPGDEEILKEQFSCLERLYDFNATRPSEYEKRMKLLKEMFAEIGEGCYIEPPFHANFGGAHCHFGKSVYANFNLTVVDDTHVYVGDYTMFGPNVLAFGNPCKVYREIGEHDREYYFKERKIPEEIREKYGL